MLTDEVKENSSEDNEKEHISGLRKSEKTEPVPYNIDICCYLS